MEYACLCDHFSGLWFQSNRNNIACKISLAGAATSIICVVAKGLLQQIFVTATNICHNIILSQQKHCCDNHTFVMTNMSFVATKVLVAIKVLS